jgi:hypothetical protein
LEPRHLGCYEFDFFGPSATATLHDRLILNFEAEAEGITTDHIIAEILKEVPQQVELAAA